MAHILTVAEWLVATNGTHLKDDAREIARLGDGGWLSIQASRYHHCDPRVDNGRRYRSIEIGSKGVQEGPAEAALLLRDYELGRDSSVVFGRVPIDIAAAYVQARGGILHEQPPRQPRPNRLRRRGD